MPRSDAQFEQLRNASRKKILETSLALFSRLGYEGTSIRMIAQEANMAVGLLYNYFPSKEALLHAIFQQSVEDIKSSFPKPLAEATPQAQLETIIRNTFQMIEENLSFWQLFYILRVQPTVQENLQRDIEELSNIIIKELLDIFRKMPVYKNPEVDVILFIALIDGVGMHYSMSPNYYPVKEITESIVQRYCRN